MPDWTYHPFFKPLLFRMPAEAGRRLTLNLLAIQSRTSLGRRIFRLFGHGRPPESVGVSAFGLRFPTPIGVGEGIDIDAIAISVLQYLSPGFVVVGPAGTDAVGRSLATDPVRVPDHHAIVKSPRAAGPSARSLAERLRGAPKLDVPIGIALRGGDLASAIRDAEQAASFFTLPPSSADDPALLAALCEGTRKPLLLRISPDLDDRRVDEVTDIALAAGVRGCVAVTGATCAMLPGGEITGPFLHTRALAVIERIAKRHGDKLPIIGAGGIMSPDDALATLDAGARLVQVYEGLVYAGPGLPGRILHAIEHRLEHSNALPPGGDGRAISPDAPVVPVENPESAADLARARPLSSKSWMLLVFTGLVLIGAGVGALGLAATVKMLPYDVGYLGMTVEDLCHRNGCRIVHFMAHDRVSFGGSIISIGILYVWLAAEPLREGRAWAWWTLALSGMFGFASFLTYLGYGYLDVWHGIATLLLLPFYLGGIVLSRAALRGPRRIGTLIAPGARAWLWSPAGMGRAGVGFAAIGMILGGAVIMGVGVTRVFVPQDLDYMGITVQELNAINPRLVPLIAHDRAGFGGGLFSGGLTVLFVLLCGVRPGARALWIALLLSGVIGFACAIGVHPIVGYTSFTHLAPAYAGAIAFLLGIALLYRPMWHGQPGSKRFPEL